MVAKKSTAKTAPKADGQNIMTAPADADAASPVQSGQEQGPSPREQRDEINAAFEKADAKGQAAIIDETQVWLQVRGY